MASQQCESVFFQVWFHLFDILVGPAHWTSDAARLVLLMVFFTPLCSESGKFSQITAHLL